MMIKKRAPFLILATLLSFNCISQVTVCLGIDATPCAGQSVTINDCGNVGGSTGSPSSQPYTITTIPYAPDPLNTGTFVPLSDDSQSGMIPIPFSFCYWGNTYTQLIIGANNFVTFSAGGSSTWVTTTIPNAGFVPQNCIMGPWQDINPGIGGSVRYATYGTAPFRRFSISWSNVPMFSCTSQFYSSQIIIYETTNVIETHILNKQICSSWNSGNAVHGLHNITGTAAVVVPGRNNTAWSTSNEGKRFSPGALGIQWGNTLGASFPYNGGSLTIASPPAGTTGYFLKSVCAGNGSISDTTFITVSAASVTATSISDTCGSGCGVAIATPGANPPYTYSWTNLTQTTATVNNVVTGIYIVTATNTNGCPATAIVNVANILATTSSSSTLVSCPGGSDGTASAFMTPLGNSSTFQWNDPAAQTTQTAIGLAAGTYECTITSSNGCSEVVSVVVSEIPGMVGTFVNQLDVTCYTGNDGIIEVDIVNGTGPYTYSWSGSISTDSVANDLYVGFQQVDITDANGCMISMNTTLNEPSPLVIDSVSTDTMICSESTLSIGAVGSGGSTAYIYTWFENGTQISTNQYLVVDPTNTSTLYTVVLSEACGSPTTDSSFTVIFPTVIIPSVYANPLEACAPDTFKFINSSSNNSEISNTLYEFSNGTSQTTNLLDTASQLFSIPGIYDVNMTVTSFYGCIYTDFFPAIINAKERPKALFDMSTNPTTIFETKVKMFDKSVDAVSWQWSAAQANPGFSNNQNPEFTFPQVEGYYPVFLKVTSPLGCWDTLTVLLNVQSDILFYAPNAFTPDNDEHNPTWKFAVAGMDLQSFELTVYNRWGEIIWQTFDTNAEWDGTFNNKPIETGSYIWKARFRKFGKEDFQTKTGNVSILR